MQQYANVIPMAIPQKKDYFQPLQGYFDIQRNPQNQDSANISLNGQMIRIDMIGGVPKVYVQQQEYHYYQFFQWNNNLLELVLAIQDKLNNIPITDPQVKELQEVKNLFNEDVEFNKLRQLSVQQLLQGVQPSEYSQLLQGDNVKIQLTTGQEYTKFVQHLLILTQHNEIVGDLIKQNHEDLFNLDQQIRQKNNRFNEAKENLMMKYGQLRSIQERFERSKIFQILGNLQASLEEQAENFEETNQGIEDTQTYFQLRKKINRLQLIKQRFSQIM